MNESKLVDLATAPAPLVIEHIINCINVFGSRLVATASTEGTGVPIPENQQKIMREVVAIAKTMDTAIDGSLPENTQLGVVLLGMLQCTVWALQLYERTARDVANGTAGPHGPGCACGEEATGTETTFPVTGKINKYDH